MRIVVLILLVLSLKSFSLDGKELFHKYNCSSCHAPDRRVVGPSFSEISKRYGQSERAIEKVAKLIIKPKPENWPGMAYMPPFDIPFEEAKALARYVLIDSLKEIKKEKKKESIEDILDEDAQFH
ncbi:Cytochrome c551/c552 [Persephonella hydrogeniphila]|uniref:Cytochrome c551/c552 n=1 Tax=Persephonella hydrogeniphila TaxID=198703 RepID=A0A285MZ27_9AQUI|nr:c-type cytochrome [Persephonella hydrogeniphila]SNZ02444.1 Cytochrome c551/c552 [Persephonella hydrogeniphila]